MTVCYIFDIHGTIADGSHRLHHIQTTPKDWTSFFGEVSADRPILHIIGLAKRLALTGACIVYVSGQGLFSHCSSTNAGRNSTL